MHSTDNLARRLLCQAEGSTTTEAAVMLLAEAVHGRLLDSVTLAWNDDERSMAAIDWDATRNSLGYLSGGERRLLGLADSLATGRPVDLSDALTGLDDHNALVVVNAIEHACGSRRQGR